MENLKDKNILIFGGQSYVGGFLKKYLVKNGVKFFSPDEHHLDPYSTIEVKDKFSSIIYLNDKSGIPESWQEPGEYFKVNAYGLLNAVEYARKSEAHFIYLSGCIYGENVKNPISETQIINPTNPYAFSKKTAEDILQFYFKNYSFPSVIVRPFNIYGPGQSNNFIISKIVDQVTNAGKSHIEVFDLEPKRDYIYIDDIISFIIRLLNFKNHDVFNLGTGKSHSVLDVVSAIQAIFGSSKKVISLNQIRDLEARELVADMSKAKSILGWEASIGLKDGLRKIKESIK